MKRWYVALLGVAVVAALAVPVLGAAAPGWGPGGGMPWGAGNGGPGFGPGGMRGGPGIGPAAGLRGPAGGLMDTETMTALHNKVHAVVAEALGVSVADLDAALQGGKTLTDVATEKGTTLAAVQEKAQAGHNAYVQELVAAGKLTPEQGNLLQNRPAFGAVSPTGPWGGIGRMGGPRGVRPGVGPGFGPGPMMGLAGDPAQIAEIMTGLQTRVHTAVAGALGITVSDFDAALQSGKTLTDLAQEKGIAIDTLTETAKSVQAAYIAEQVSAGKLTKEQGDALQNRPAFGSKGAIGGPRGGRGPGPGFGRGPGAGGQGFGPAWRTSDV